MATAPAAPTANAPSPAARRAAALIATTGWLALSMQLTVTIGMMTADGHSVPAAIWRYLGYFTILTNVLVAITMSRIAWPRTFGGDPSASAVTGTVLAIAVVGVVYHWLLSAIVPAMGPLWWTADRLLHYLIPAASVVWWVAFASTHDLGLRDPIRWLAFPVSYLVYALARGAVDGWYPYFFINVATIGYTRTFTNAALLSAATLVVGYAVVGLVLWSRSRRSS